MTYTMPDFDTDCFAVYEKDGSDFVCSHFQVPNTVTSPVEPIYTSVATTYNFNNILTDMLVIWLAFTIFCPILLSLFKLMMPNAFKLFTNQFKEQGTVTIVRGVPGSGKRHYVYDQERGQTGRFGVCDWNDFFTDEEGNHQFDGTQITQAEFHSHMAFLSFVKREVSRIYVIGYFPKLWNYEPYLEMAKLNGYKVNVVELKCENLEQLRHFNKRSIHKVPFAKSKKCFESWEIDYSSVYQEPYLEELPGDCIPSYGTVTKEQLDKELEEYMNNKQVVESDQEDNESDSDYDPKDDADSYSDDSNDDFEEEPEYTDNLVRHLDEDYINFVTSREVYYE
jgi:hypothetical protein